MTDTPPVEPRFGTDGLRGKAGEPPLDAPTLRRVSAALGIWLQQAGPERKRVLIGHDGRASASWIRHALIEGLAATGASATDLGLVTTPALAFTTRIEPFVAGIMISASHNPASDNGIKIFDADGAKLSDEAERHIEGLTGEAAFEVSGRPRYSERPELLRGYEEFLGHSFPDLDLSGRTIVVDGANGGGSVVAPTVLRLFGANVVEHACEPDGENINRGVGALHPEQLVGIVREHGALLGICLDGDGDRGIFVDDLGNVRNGDDVMAALGRHLNANDALPGNTVVATVMSNLGLTKALERHGVSVHSTPVGDRSVVQAMRAHGYTLGGEQSGHIIFARDGHHAGDGLLTALELLALPAVLERGTAPLFEGFRRYPQTLLNLEVATKPELDGLEGVQSAVRAVEADLGSDGRVVLRYSGTENLCRVMVEGPEEGAVQRHANAIADAVREALS